MKIDRVNGYEIIYLVQDKDGRKVIETSDRAKAVKALMAEGRTLSTRAL